MFKIMVKDGPNDVVVKEVGDTPVFASVEWEDLRKSPKYQGKPLELIATWNGDVILRHRFDSKPGEPDYLLVDFNTTAVFYKAAGIEFDSKWLQ